MRRRHFMFLTTTGMAALSLPIACSSSGEVSFPNDLAKPELLQSIWEEETMRQIGFAYRQMNPEEAEQAKLLAKLYEYVKPDESNLIEEIARQTIEDFKLAHTIQIDGWILSRTEARQCALYSLNI